MMLAYRKGVLAAIAGAVVFGVHPSLTQMAYADGANAVFVLLVTTAMRALSLWGFCAAKGRALFKSREDIRFAALGGLFQALSVCGIFGALVFLPGSVVIIIVFLHSLMLLLFMGVRGEEALNAVTLGLTLAALAGLTFVLDLWGTQTEIVWPGLALAGLGAVATAARVFLYARMTRMRNPAVVGAEVFIFVCLYLLILMVFIMPEAPLTWAGYGFTILSGLSLSLGTFCMFYGLSFIGAFRYTMLAKLEPVFTALFAFILLQEVLSFGQYAGMVVVIGVLAAYQYLEQRKTG